MKWHYDGQFPPDLDKSRAGTHIGMYLAWCVINELESENLKEWNPIEIEALRSRKITGREFLQKYCDETFVSDQLSDLGQRFTHAYYMGAGVKPEDTYMTDYDVALCSGLPGPYHVQDTWVNFDKLAQKIDGRFKKFTTK